MFFRELRARDGRGVLIREITENGPPPPPGNRSSGDGVKVSIEVDGEHPVIATVRADLLALRDQEILAYLEEQLLVIDLNRVIHGQLEMVEDVPGDGDRFEKEYASGPFVVYESPGGGVIQECACGDQLLVKVQGGSDVVPVYLRCKSGHWSRSYVPRRLHAKMIRHGKRSAEDQPYRFATPMTR